MTMSTLKVLGLMRGHLTKEFSGAEITRLIGIPSGTLYPVLIRLEKAGWLESRWEKIDPSEEGRPRRRFYKLSALGERRTAAVLQELYSPQGQPAWT